MKHGRLVTIGTFDGVHRGHQALLARAVHEARKRHMKSLAITFKIPPRMILMPPKPLSLLSSPLEKDWLLRSHGVDEVEFLDFNSSVAAIRPFSFFRDILINQYRAKGLVVGADFRFGIGRSAGAIELVQWGQEFEIPVWVVSPVRVKKDIVSSTLIRENLEAGRLREVNRLLGHPYLIYGQVVKGHGLGRKIGFPTINLQTSVGKSLPRGIFIVNAWFPVLSNDKKRILNRKYSVFRGVCNIGTRPTVSSGATLSVEVHLLNFTPQFKGHSVMVEILHRIRSEKKFSSVDLLKKTIQKDVKQAFLYFLRHPGTPAKTPALHPFGKSL